MPFSYEGFPIFDQYATKTVVLKEGFAKRRDSDFKKADELAGFTEPQTDMTWHHKEDGKTLILIDKKLHGAVRHWGGVVITKALNRWEGRTGE